MPREEHIDGTAVATVRRTISVNGRHMPWDGDDIGGRDLARLAFPTADHAAGGRSLTVTWSGGPAGAESGILPHGTRTLLADRQAFNVGLTDKS